MTNKTDANLIQLICEHDLQRERGVGEGYLPSGYSIPSAIQLFYNSSILNNDFIALELIV